MSQIVGLGTAQPGHVLTGETFTSGSGADQQGSMPNNGSVTLTPSGTGTVQIPQGYHDGTGKVAQVNVPAANVLAGTTIAGVAGTMPENGALGTITPGTAAQNIPAGHTTGGTVAGDVNLVAGNIVSGKSIFGVNGNVTPFSQPASGSQTYSTPGTFSFKVPSNVTRVLLEMIGAGGGANPTSGDYAGGQGCYVGAFVDVTPGSTITGTIGAGGQTGSTPSSGGSTTVTVGNTTYTIPGGSYGSTSAGGSGAVAPTANADWAIDGGSNNNQPLVPSKATTFTGGEGGCRENQSYYSGANPYAMSPPTANYTYGSSFQMNSGITISEIGAYLYFGGATTATVTFNLLIWDASNNVLLNLPCTYNASTTGSAFINVFFPLSTPLTLQQGVTYWAGITYTGTIPSTLNVTGCASGYLTGNLAQPTGTVTYSLTGGGMYYVTSPNTCPQGGTLNSSARFFPLFIGTQQQNGNDGKVKITW